MAGVKGRSGRKKEPGTIRRETLQRAEQDFPKLWDINTELALKGDKDALKLYFSYVLGAPKQVIDARVAAAVAVAPEDYVLAIRKAQEDESKLLTEAKMDS